MDRDEGRLRPSESNRVRVWVVDRTYEDDSPHAQFVYATEDGERYTPREVLVDRNDAGPDPNVTAAIEVDLGDLEAVTDRETSERYAQEVRRVMARYDPDDPIRSR